MQPPPRYALRQNFGQGNGYRRKATPRIDAALTTHRRAISRDEHAPETTDDEGIVDSIIDGELARALSELPEQTANCRRHAA